MRPVGLIHKDVSAILKIGNLQYGQGFLEIVSFQQSQIAPLVLTLKIDPPTITPPIAPSVLSRGVNLRKNILNFGLCKVKAEYRTYSQLNSFDIALPAEHTSFSRQAMIAMIPQLFSTWSLVSAGWLCVLWWH